MKIYFDGCSWTEGAELNNQEEERFSKLICNQLDAEETNLAKGGGSNDRIVRNLLVENNIEHYDYVVIQMTFPARTEYWDKEWIRVSGKHNYNKWLYGENGDIRRLGEKFTNHQQFWKYYYLSVANVKYFDTKEKIHYETIRNYCKSKGVPLVLCSINNWSKIRFDHILQVKNEHSAEYGHPNAQGHQLIAEKIIKSL